jgi:hypothetical protein
MRAYAAIWLICLPSLLPWSPLAAAGAGEAAARETQEVSLKWYEVEDDSAVAKKSRPEKDGNSMEKKAEMNKESRPRLSSFH